MSFKNLKIQVEKSDEFKKFRKENPKAILYSAFFMLKQTCGNLIVENQQLDYWLGKEKVATFFFDENESVKSKVDEVEPMKEGEKRDIQELDEKEVKLDVDDLQKIIKKELEKNKVDMNELSKTIAILQKIKGKIIWNITCVSGLSLYRIHVDEDGKVLESKKESILSMMKIESGKKKK